MIKNCIFDFGNVLAVFDPDRLTAPYFPDEALRREISEVVFDRLYWDRLDEGTISDEEVKAGIRSRVGAEYADRACEVYDGWIENLTPVSGMADVVRQLKNSGKRLYLLSNISEGFAEKYKEIKWIRELFELFDGLVFSGKIKLVKPDEKIFRYVLDTFGLEKSESVFVDDNPANIAGAQNAGIRGILFDGSAAELRNYFK